MPRNHQSHRRNVCKSQQSREFGKRRHDAFRSVRADFERKRCVGSLADPFEIGVKKRDESETTHAFASSRAGRACLFLLAFDS
jgi:hypothetical protein